jgi:hypothetical protein
MNRKSEQYGKRSTNIRRRRRRSGRRDIKRCRWTLGRKLERERGRARGREQRGGKRTTTTTTTTNDSTEREAGLIKKQRNEPHSKKKTTK